MTASALLLDLDRTLVDLQTSTDYAAALDDVRVLVGSWDDADVPDTDWDRPTQACMSVLHAMLGDPRWHAVSDAIAQHERRAIPQATVMPTVLDALPVLADVPVAVVTLLPTDVATDVLVTHGIDVGAGRPVDLVIGRDPAIRPKPQPDGLLEACRRLGVAPSSVTMVGDSSWDRDAAVAAGVAFVGVPTTPGAFAPDVVVAGSFAEAVDGILQR